MLQLLALHHPTARLFAAVCHSWTGRMYCAEGRADPGLRETHSTLYSRSSPLLLLPAIVILLPAHGISLPFVLHGIASIAHSLAVRKISHHNKSYYYIHHLQDINSETCHYSYKLGIADTAILKRKAQPSLCYHQPCLKEYRRLWKGMPWVSRRLLCTGRHANTNALDVICVHMTCIVRWHTP